MLKSKPLIMKKSIVNTIRNLYRFVVEKLGASLASESGVYLEQENAVVHKPVDQAVAKPVSPQEFLQAHSLADAAMPASPVVQEGVSYLSQGMIEVFRDTTGLGVFHNPATNTYHFRGVQDHINSAWERSLVLPADIGDLHTYGHQGVTPEAMFIVAAHMLENRQYENYRETTRQAIFGAELALESLFREREGRLE